MKKVIFIYAALVIVVIALALTRVVNFGGFFSGSKSAKATVGSAEFSVTIADDDEKRKIGLSATEKLEDNEGMLFLFEQKGKYSFWMRNMKFPIDIIFIDTPVNDKGEFGNEGVIIDIAKNASVPAEATPLSDLTRYEPQNEVNMVLEVNAGISEKNGFEVGNTVKFDGLK